MASKGALLPCMNRYCSQIIDHNGHGLIAYGAIGCIYVLDLTTDLPSILDPKVIRNAHRGRVLSLSFCKSSSNKLLASIGDEKTLKIWDLELAANCIATINVKDTTQLVEWLYDTTNLVVFSENSGNISKWNFSTDNFVKIKTGSDRSVTAMSSNQYCPELLAVGHCVGTISIVNVITHTYMKSLKSHSMDIQSLSWSPVSPSLLLSSSLDQSIRLWNIDEAQPVHTYYYPSSRYKDKQENKKNTRVCSVFHPEKPNVIMCSNVRGTLGSVQFNENAPPKFTPFATADGDSNFKSTLQMLPYVDVTNSNKHILITCDPTKLSLWNVTDEKLLSSHYFIQGNVFDISVSPVSNKLMAVGIGDGFLKVLDMEAEQKLNNVTSVYVNLKMKLMSIAWHPSEENIIAYGSDEGRVGIVDIYKKKCMYSFETHHTHTVYTVQWGPCSKINDSKQTYFLYSCGGGSIFIHELGKPKQKATAIETILNLPADIEMDHKTYSELRWKPDYTCLALGCFDGSVYLYNDKFDFLARLRLHMKNVEDLKWHPIHTYSSSHSEKSQYSSWLAVVGNDEKIHVFDTQEILSRPPEAGICKPTRTLTGHKKRANTLCWSPHTDGHLVSGARDGVVQVWNVITGVPIASYIWHKDRIHSVYWSTTNPDVIYSGGMDNCLRVWKISEQNQQIPTKLLLTKHRHHRSKPKAPHIEKTSSEALDSSKKKEREDSISETKAVSEAPSKQESVAETTKQPRPRVEPNEYKKSFFGVKNYSKEETFQNVFKLVDFLCDESVSNDGDVTEKMTSDELLNLGVYMDQFTALKLLETKGKMEVAAGSKDRAACLQVMACNLNELLVEAAEQKNLTDFLVSLSPSVSYKCWLNMCEKYAVQLIEEQQFVKSSLYFVLCGKLYEALKILIDKGRLLDALALAKARLPEDDPVIKSILYKLANMHRYKKELESEAASLIASRDPLSAAKVMYCAGGAKYAYAAAYICKKFNMTEVAHDYAILCVEKCLSQSDWPTFYKVAELVESVQIYKVLFRVHEVISTHIKSLKKEEGAVGNNIFGVTGTKILIWSGKMLENSNSFLTTYLYDVLKSEGLLPEDKKILKDIHEALNSLEIRKSEMSTDAHITVAICLSQVILTSLLGDLDSATKYFTKIFSSTHSVVFMPKIISWILFPFDIYWCSNKNTFLCEVKQMNMEILPSSTHFHDIFNSVSNRFECSGHSDAEVLDLSPLKTSSLDLAVKQVLTFLSKKTTEDSLVLYFTTQYLNELRRLAKRGWRYRCYENGQVCKMPEGVTYVYNSETGQWLINSDEASDVENSVSKEDVLKLDLQDKFKLNVTGDEDPDAPSITDIITHVFSSEMDCDTKDLLVQRYGFKDVSNFLQSVMAGFKENTQVINQHSSSVENLGDQKDECIASLINGGDEDLHAQCWTDVGLYYVVTKSLLSTIFRDEYALRYSLRRYLVSLDKKIADLALLKSTGISNQKSEKSKDVKEKKRNLNITVNSISSLPTENSSLSVSVEHNVIHENKIESNQLEDVEKVLVDHSENKPVELNGSNIVDNDANFGKANECEFTDVIAMNGNEDKIPDIPSLNSKVDAVSLPNKTKDEEITSENKINVLSDKDESFKEDNSMVNIHISVPCEETKVSNNICSNEVGKTENGSDDLPNKTKDEEITSENKINVLSDKDESFKEDNSMVNIHISVPCEETKVSNNICSNEVDKTENGSDDLPNKTKDEEITSENKINVLSDKDESFKEDNSMVNIHISVPCEGTKVSNNICSNEADKTENGSDDSIQQKLQIEQEKISDQIKLLELEEFWYPDPFVSVEDIKGICCDIFRKHPCPLIKQKFHEFAHEVDELCTKFCLTDTTSMFCEICKKISA